MEIFPVFINIYLHSETQYISEAQQSLGDDISGHWNSNLATSPSVRKKANQNTELRSRVRNNN